MTLDQILDYLAAQECERAGNVHTAAAMMEVLRKEMGR